MAEKNLEQSDIEIYVRDINIDALIKWLKVHFSSVELTSNKKEDVYRGKVQSNAESQAINIVVLMGSAGKAFSSVWFKSPATPWASDLDCARSYSKSTGSEVRCSPGSWEEDDEQNDNQWWRVTPESETIIKW